MENKQRLQNVTAFDAFKQFVSCSSSTMKLVYDQNFQSFMGEVYSQIFQNQRTIQKITLNMTLRKILGNLLIYLCVKSRTF